MTQCMIHQYRVITDVGCITVSCSVRCTPCTMHRSRVYHCIYTDVGVSLYHGVYDTILFIEVCAIQPRFFYSCHHVRARMFKGCLYVS